MVKNLNWQGTDQLAIYNKMSLYSTHNVRHTLKLGMSLVLHPSGQ